ncbi:hypothetical protein [Staphylococcus equorum]|uniref:hypothetical protein n=1 Tax=Staphylococcus equorum TaxID=246432 RepID=UPI000852C2BD|nr:hypothetical protein [Staphylococcus equorum]OEK60603.1 hypothetical protein ASS99_11110 [Staphylococcus equorum]
MHETEDEKQSYKLEQQADTLIIDVLRNLAEATDKRCLAHGRTRYLDKQLLKKCVHLTMIYDNAPTMDQFCKNTGLAFSTLSRILNDNNEYTANRANVEKIINYMYKVADDYETKINESIK